VEIINDDSKHVTPNVILYRTFECQIVDFRVENAVFKTLSDQKMGPRCYYQCGEYRVEEFFHSRPLTIFEMRNDIFMKAFAEKICHFNFNQKAIEEVLPFMPKTKRVLDQVFENWYPKVKTILLKL